MTSNCLSIWHPMVHPIINGQFCLFIKPFYSLNGYLVIILHYYNCLLSFLCLLLYVFCNIHVTLNIIFFFLPSVRRFVFLMSLMFSFLLPYVYFSPLTYVCANSVIGRPAVESAHENTLLKWVQLLLYSDFTAKFSMFAKRTGHWSTFKFQL